MKRLISALSGFLGFSGRASTKHSTKPSPQFVYIQIPEQIGPLDRQAKYGNPLDFILKSENVGEVSGGGSMLSAPDENGNRTIEFIGLDVDLSDFERGMPILKIELVSLTVPKGTVLQYSRDGVKYSEPVE